MYYFISLLDDAPNLFQANQAAKELDHRDLHKTRMLKKTNIARVEVVDLVLIWAKLRFVLKGSLLDNAFNLVVGCVIQKGPIF